MANNTEDVELLEKLQQIAKCEEVVEEYSDGKRLVRIHTLTDERLHAIEQLIQQEANRQKAELLDRAEDLVSNPKKSPYFGMDEYGIVMDFIELERKQLKEDK